MTHREGGRGEEGVGEMEIRGVNFSMDARKRKIREIKDAIKGEEFFYLKVVKEKEQITKKRNKSTTVWTTRPNFNMRDKVLLFPFFFHLP